MKKTKSFILIGMLAFSILVGEARADDKAMSTDLKYSPGSRTKTEYTSDWLGLKYTLNDDMIMASDDEINNLMKIGLDMLDDDAQKTGEKILQYSKIAVVFEMMAVNMVDGSNLNIIAEKLLLSGMTEEQYIKATKIQFEQIGSAILNETTICEIFGIEFIELKTVPKALGDGQNHVLLIKKINDRMAVITFTYNDQTELDTLFEGFSAYY